MTRDGTHAPESGAPGLKHWPRREVPSLFLRIFNFHPLFDLLGLDNMEVKHFGITPLVLETLFNYFSIYFLYHSDVVLFILLSSGSLTLLYFPLHSLDDLITDEHFILASPLFTFKLFT